MRLSLSRLAVLAVCLVVGVAAAVPATAGAASGYHMTRQFVDTDGSTARAVGKICTGSKFGKWRWRVSIGSGDLQATYRWIEPVYPDGKARHLSFTYIGGQIVEDQPPSLRDMFTNAIKRALNRITVKYSGGRLVYTNPVSGGTSTKAFKPGQGC